MAIKTTAHLASAIQTMEAKKLEQEEGLTKQFAKTYESLNPVNIIKNTINEVANTPGVKDNLLNFSVGIGTGIITKKLMIGKSDSLLKKIIGGAIEFGVANLVTGNAGFIREKGMQALSNFIKRKKISS